MVRKLILTVCAILILFSSSYAINETTINETEAGFTPDNTILYNFDKFGEWVQLNFAKLQGDKQFQEKKAEFLQERLAEFKLVKNETKAEFKIEIDNEIKQRDIYQETVKKDLEFKIETLQKARESRDLNETQREEFKLQIEGIKDQIKTNEKTDERIKEFDKEEKDNRDDKKEEHSRAGGSGSSETRLVTLDNNDLNQVNVKYSDFLTQMEGKKFRVSGDSQEYFFQVDNAQLNLVQNLSNIDYELTILDAGKFTEKLTKGDLDVREFGEYLKVPLNLKVDILALSVAN